MQAQLYRLIRARLPGGPETHRYLRELGRTQWYSRDELETWQLERLRRLVRYAYENVPYYRRTYGALGIRPEDVRTFEDFRRLPFLTRDDVNDNLDDLLSPEFRGRAKLDSTGGSTGVPMRFYVEKSFHWWDAALEFRGRGWYGVREGDRVAWVWGAYRDMDAWSRKARLKAWIQQNRYLNAFGMNEPKMKAFAEMLVRWRPAMIRAYASALTMLAEYIEARGLPAPRPQCIETTAEKTSDAQREVLERVFRCPVSDWYTAREFGTVGFQCPSRSMHICETRFLEVVSEGRDAGPDRLGEIVLTSLNQMATPLIRYKIGDMGILEPGRCSCGRALPVLREIVGRVQDFLVGSDGLYVYGGYFPHTFRNWPEIRRYQVRQPDRSRLEVRLVLRRPVDSGWVEMVRAEIQGRFGPGVAVSIALVDEIELTAAGKHLSILSEVRPDFS